MTKTEISTILENVLSWSRKDQEELAEVAREIDARRGRVYVLTKDERAAIAKSRKSPLASEKKVKAFWKRHGIAT